MIRISKVLCRARSPVVTTKGYLAADTDQPGIPRLSDGSDDMLYGIKEELDSESRSRDLLMLDDVLLTVVLDLPSKSVSHTIGCM